MICYLFFLYNYRIIELYKKNKYAKYAFLGSLRSTAAMISYELILSSAVIVIIMLTGSFNYTTIMESQQAI